jgi:hypothetical protein
VDSHKNTINAGNSVISEEQVILPSSPFKDKENDKDLQSIASKKN